MARDEDLRKEIIEEYRRLPLYRENAEFKMRLEFYQDVAEIKALLRQIVDKMEK